MWFLEGEEEGNEYGRTEKDAKADVCSDGAETADNASKGKDRMFYYHSTEDRIVLSHALFWVMTQPRCLKGKIRKVRLPSVTTFSPRDILSKLSSPLGLPKEFFLLLRQYEEEMLDSFLMEDDYFSERLRYCNILFEMLPTILMSTALKTVKDARKLAAIAVVAASS